MIFFLLLYDGPQSPLVPLVEVDLLPFGVDAHLVLYELLDRLPAIVDLYGWAEDDSFKHAGAVRRAILFQDRADQRDRLPALRGPQEDSRAGHLRRRAPAWPRAAASAARRPAQGDPLLIDFLDGDEGALAMRLPAPTSRSPGQSRMAWGSLVATGPSASAGRAPAAKRRLWCSFSRMQWAWEITRQTSGCVPGAVGSRGGRPPGPGAGAPAPARPPSGAAGSRISQNRCAGSPSARGASRKRGSAAGRCP